MILFPGFPLFLWNSRKVSKYSLNDLRCDWRCVSFVFDESYSAYDSTFRVSLSLLPITRGDGVNGSPAKSPLMYVKGHELTNRICFLYKQVQRSQLGHLRMQSPQLRDNSLKEWPARVISRPFEMITNSTF